MRAWIIGGVLLATIAFGAWIGHLHDRIATAETERDEAIAATQAAEARLNTQSTATVVAGNVAVKERQIAREVAREVETVRQAAGNGDVVAPAVDAWFDGIRRVRNAAGVGNSGAFNPELNLYPVRADGPSAAAPAGSHGRSEADPGLERPLLRGRHDGGVERHVSARHLDRRSFRVFHRPGRRHIEM